MGNRVPNYLWRKSATPEWLRANEAALSELTKGEFAVIERPGSLRVAVESHCRNGSITRDLVRAFGGKSERLPHDWFEQFLRVEATRPIRVGKRLLVTNVGSSGPNVLVIPAGMAFGTGEHATTAMSLRLLEEETRGLTSDWRMLDAGTGSGILALAGKRFGAAHVLAIDHDPMSISTAKQNARANRIRGVEFVAGNVLKKLSGKYDIITANLYSELLVSVLPKFRRNLAANGYLILSGVLGSQERQLRRALTANRFQIHQLRRRGKWIALVAAASKNRVDANSRQKHLLRP